MRAWERMRDFFILKRMCGFKGQAFKHVAYQFILIGQSMYLFNRAVSI